MPVRERIGLGRVAQASQLMVGSPIMTRITGSRRGVTKGNKALVCHVEDETEARIHGENDKNYGPSWNEVHEQADSVRGEPAPFRNSQQEIPMLRSGINSQAPMSPYPATFRPIAAQRRLKAHGKEKRTRG